MNFSYMEGATKFFQLLGYWKKQNWMRKIILLNFSVCDETYNFSPCRQYKIGGKKQSQLCFCVHSTAAANSVAPNGTMLSWKVLAAESDCIICISFHHVSGTQDYATSSAKCAERQHTMPHRLSLPSLCISGRLPLKQGAWAAYVLSHVQPRPR